MLNHDETQDLLTFVRALCATAGWKSYARRIDRIKRRIAAQAFEEANSIAVPVEVLRGEELARVIAEAPVPSSSSSSSSQTCRHGVGPDRPCGECGPMGL